MTDAEVPQFLNYINSSKILGTRTNIGYHVAYREGFLYPTNHVRNIALRQATTQFVFLLDVDFVPRNGTYEDIRKFLKTQFESDSNSLSKKAFVIPAFETFLFNLELPKSKEELISLWVNKKVYQFVEKLSSPLAQIS